MAEEEEIFEVVDLDDIEADPFPTDRKQSLSGDVDTILREIERGKIPYVDVRRLLQNSTTLHARPGGGRPVGHYSKSSGDNVKSPFFQSSTFANGRSYPFRFQFQNYKQLIRPVKFFASNTNPTDGMVVLPVPPETIEMTGGNTPEEVVSAAGITFSHAGPFTPLTMTFEGIFPYVNSITEVPDFVPEDTIRAGFYNPPALCAKFITAMRAGQPVVFNIVRPGTSEKLMSSHVVVITDFTWSFKMGHGKTRFWSMTLREWFPQHLVLAGRKKKRHEQGNGNGNGSRPSPPAGKTYIIKKGDSLWKIADRFLGDGRKWKEIYKLNKAKLNKSLKEHGQPLNNPDLIYPGVSIIIPAKSKK